MDNNQLKRVDGELFEASKKVRIVHFSNPINKDEEKDRFFQSETYNPIFKYKEFDDEGLETTLKNLEIPNSELGNLFKEKLNGTLREINSLKNRGTTDYTNTENHGVPSDKLIKSAYDILKNPKQDSTSEGKGFPADYVKKELEQTLNKFGFEGWEVRSDETVLKTTISIENRLIELPGKDTFTEHRIKKLKIHEIGTHALRAMNGYEQDYKIFAAGLFGYLPTEEGLSMINEDKSGLGRYSLLKDYACRVIAVAFALDGSFRETFNEIAKFFDPEKAFELTTRAKRGLGDTSKPGGFIKDHVYLQGKLILEDFLKEGGDLTPLYAGRIGVQHLYLVDKGVIKPPKYLPVSNK